MIRPNYYFYFLLTTLFFISGTTYAQNFDETWKEFLENNKISNMSELIRPNKATDRKNYVKYLLMNTNSNFCQSKVENAENLVAEIREINPEGLQSIPGFVVKLEDLETKIKAYYSMDRVWSQFLRTKDVSPEKLDAIKGVKSLCEKRTLAKYSYMMAYYHFCQGDISESRNIFENRTLRLAERTTLRIAHIDGMPAEVAKMKSMYQDMSKLDVAWKSYVQSGVSPGFDIDLPLFPCNPIPNMKAFVLKGILDVCHSGPKMLAQIKDLQTKSGVTPDRELMGKIKELEAAIEQTENNVADLNKAWDAFVPENRVLHTYGYEFCSKEPLIRAYIMDGFTFVCEMAEESLQKIDDLQSSNAATLDETTMNKINELHELNEQYQYNGVTIERLWSQFVTNDDTLIEDYESTDLYCDNIHKVKDWTMKGLSGTCEEGIPYLEQIEEFNRTFEFKFYKDLECRVQNLRIKIWDCRQQALLEIARLEESTTAQDEKLKTLMEEYGMEERPGDCLSEE